jgi:hypothetical protein
VLRKQIRDRHFYWESYNDLNLDYVIELIIQ